MSVKNNLRDCFLIKENEIIPFQAEEREGTLYLHTTAVQFRQGDFIIYKASETPPLAQIDKVTHIIINERENSTSVAIEHISHQSAPVKDIKDKLKNFGDHIHNSDISHAHKESLLSKIEELETAIGTSKYERVLQEIMGLLFDYEQYIPAILQLAKL